MQSHCFSVLNKNGIVPEAKMKHTYKKKKKKTNKRRNRKNKQNKPKNNEDKFNVL